ncbi:MAG: dihydropteroate synthase [Gammaproteobacteria bacterium]
MRAYFGLGSNLGDRHAHLRRAVERLREAGLRIIRLSPVVESPALLPKSAPAAWNLPFFNLVAEVEVSESPAVWRQRCKTIQDAFGEPPASRWAPRPIDIDILLWGDTVCADPDLTIPQRDLEKRPFVISPLVHLQPRLRLPGLGDKTVLEWSRQLPYHLPLWMGILNITPDSFSDGGRYTEWNRIDPHLTQMVEAGAHIIDIGAESTRPGAAPITAEQEWLRLEPTLACVLDRFKGMLLKPLISVDTYRPATAARALALGVDIINDVSGLGQPAMVELAKGSGKDWIAMHQLTLPVDSNITLPPDCDPYAEVERWLMQKLEYWDKAGLDFNRIVFDPGIGFGKNGLQSLAILRRAGELRRQGLRLLIGHSRKSFLKNFTALAELDKDLATVGASMQLCGQGVDVVRVHHIPLHVAAYKGWVHLQPESAQLDGILQGASPNQALDANYT